MSVVVVFHVDHKVKWKHYTKLDKYLYLIRRQIIEYESVRLIMIGALIFVIRYYRYRNLVSTEQCDQILEKSLIQTTIINIE